MGLTAPNSLFVVLCLCFSRGARLLSLLNGSSHTSSGVSSSAINNSSSAINNLLNNSAIYSCAIYSLSLSSLVARYERYTKYNSK